MINNVHHWKGDLNIFPKRCGWSLQHKYWLSYVHFKLKKKCKFYMYPCFSHCFSIRSSKSWYIEPNSKIHVRAFQNFKKEACLSICLSVCLSVHQSVCPSICPSICLSFCPSVCFSVCLPARICPPFCLPDGMSVCLYVGMSVCLFVSLYVCCMYVCM